MSNRTQANLSSRTAYLSAQPSSASSLPHRPKPHPPLHHNAFFLPFPTSLPTTNARSTLNHASTVIRTPKDKCQRSPNKQASLPPSSRSQLLTPSPPTTPLHSTPPQPRKKKGTHIPSTKYPPYIPPNPCNPLC